MQRAPSFANGAFVLVGKHLSVIEGDRQLSTSGDWSSPDRVGTRVIHAIESA